MRFIKIENKDGNLLIVLDMSSLYYRIYFKKFYSRLKKIDQDTYRFKF